MNFLVYCQHVLGIGHLCRILLILNELKRHRVTLVLGGPPVALALPDHVRVIQLPGIRMDEDFSGLLQVNQEEELASIKEQRTRQLLSLFDHLQPDLLLVELFPFGRNAFHFELLPLLERAKESKKCKIVCSVRDILVERDNKIKFEQRVIDRLNRFFDLLLIHGDPGLIKLNDTFSRMNDIKIPLSYTGYICQMPQPGDRERIRKQLAMADEERLIMVSAGSGSVGLPLLTAAADAFALLGPQENFRLQMFTGPYIVKKDFENLAASMNGNYRIETFSENFPAWLAASDLSISMGGYNTTMNLIAAGCRALVFPFPQNHEQRIRAEHLEQRGCLQVINDCDLRPPVLAEIITTAMKSDPQQPDIILDGARQAAEKMFALVQEKR